MTCMVRKSPNPTDKYVGLRLRMRRQTLGKSQTWLADAVNLTFQQIQKYEKGTNRIGSSRLQQFAQILDVPISYFFKDAPGATLESKASHGAPTTTYLYKFIASEDGQALMKAFVEIKDKKIRRGIARLVEQIASKPED
jgi:transcriptional regulator with XRE-family HTH domain